MEPAIQSVRIDKWLWSVRLYKSRSMASEACARGQVNVNGQPAKASRCVKPGDVITALVGDLNRSIKVIALLDQRVGAKLVSQFLEDLTSPAEYARPKEKNFQPFIFRPKGSGRPTKKERRSIQGFFQ